MSRRLKDCLLGAVGLVFVKWALDLSYVELFLYGVGMTFLVVSLLDFIEDD